MAVRAKLTLAEVTEHSWLVNGQRAKTLKFMAIYDQDIPEDQRFQQATPTGHAELQIDNPVALAQFEIGKSYYVDFTPVPEA
jgi:hypothetical protein